jgi:crooked neck
MSRTSEEPGDPDEGAPVRAARARDVYQRAYRSMRENQPDSKEEAVMLLEAWKAFEVSQDTTGGVPEAELAANVEVVQKKMPKRVKRKRPVRTDDGMEVGQEEYYDYIFPEEAGAAPHLKLLELAYKHKRQKMEAAAEEEDDAGEGAAGDGE